MELLSQVTTDDYQGGLLGLEALMPSAYQGLVLQV